VRAEGPLRKIGRFFDTQPRDPVSGHASPQREVSLPASVSRGQRGASRPVTGSKVIPPWLGGAPRSRRRCTDSGSTRNLCTLVAILNGAIMRGTTAQTLQSPDCPLRPVPPRRCSRSLTDGCSAATPARAVPPGMRECRGQGESRMLDVRPNPATGHQPCPECRGQGQGQGQGQGHSESRMLDIRPDGGGARLGG
jgi:hypothetical protein